MKTHSSEPLPSGIVTYLNGKHMHILFLSKEKTEGKISQIISGVISDKYNKNSEGKVESNWERPLKVATFDP